jgi:hypothetical protein
VLAKGKQTPTVLLIYNNQVKVRMTAA